MQRRSFSSLWPGLALSGGIAALAFVLRTLPGAAVFSPMILAVVIGIVAHNFFGVPAAVRIGVNFSARQILRFAVAMLGLQLTIAQVAEIGWLGIMIIILALATNFLFTK